MYQLYYQLLLLNYAVTVILLTLPSSSTAMEVTSDSCNEALLSGTSFRVINKYFSSSGSLDDYHQPYDVRLNGRGWCSNPLGFNVIDPWLKIEFGSIVAITGIKMSGALNNSFIKSFHLRYDNDDNFDTLMNSGLKKSTEFSNLTLQSLKVGSTITVLPYEWETQTPCLRLELYGCLRNPICTNVAILDIFKENFEQGISDDKFYFGPVVFNYPVVITNVLATTQVMLNSSEKMEIINADSGFAYQDFNGTSVFNTSRVFTFWKPLFLNFSITVNFTTQSSIKDNDMLTVEFHGCNQTDALSSLIIINSTASLTILSSDPPSVTMETNLALITGLPIAIATIAIVLFITICAISCNCYITSRRRKRDNTNTNYIDDDPNIDNFTLTLKRINNEILYEANDDTSSSCVLQHEAIADKTYDSIQPIN